jgi:hypothetical protein
VRLLPNAGLSTRNIVHRNDSIKYSSDMHGVAVCQRAVEIE